MKYELTASAVLGAALISGCSSAPTLAVPTGEWESFTQQYQPVPQPVMTPLPAPPVELAQGPVTTVYTPNPVVAFTPPPGPGSTPVKPTAPTVITPVVEAAVSPAKPAAKASEPSATASPLPGVKPNPQAKIPTSSAFGVATVPRDSAKPPTPVVVAKITPPPKPLPEQWVIAASDNTLRRALNKWAVKAGWQLVWEASVDVPVNVTATFEGDFRTAVKRLFLSLSAADVNLNAMLYSGNRVLRVTESGRRAQ